jgi:hypothetical protein
MTDEENKLLARIGQALASMINGDPNGAFAYVEVREMWMAPSAFHDEGNRVVYLRTSHEFDEAVEDLWYAKDAGSRWEAMRYEIVDGQFAVEFDYPDQLDPDESCDDRRERVLKARYSDKPIYYPPPEDLPEITEADLSDE